MRTANALWVLPLAVLACGDTATDLNNRTGDSSFTSVAIQEFSFTPATVNIAVGTVVRWSNQGSVGHTVTSDEGLFSSETISAGSEDPYGGSTPGGTYSRTFSEAGTFPYHCAIHPDQMSGTVVVTEE